jgi:OmpA-OmpF porin, OOP family
MKFLSILPVIAALLFSSLAQADNQYDLTGRWGVGLGLGTSTITGPSAFKNGATELDGGFVGSIWARYHYNSRFGVEATYSRLAFDFAQNNPALDNLSPAANLFMVNAAYRAWPEEQIHMLAQAGLGYVQGNDFSPTESSKKDVAFGARLGVEYMATRDLMLALQADYTHINLGSGSNSELNVLAPMLALTYYFSPKSSAPTVGDSDNDGVNDNLDKCADTPANSNVGSDGCPLKVTKADSDGDGVLDINDKCPGTPSGAKVTEFGCAKTDKIEITLNVEFETGSSKVDPKFTADLEKFAAFMAKYTDTKAEIEGHTDNTGSEKFNFSMSQKRANNVRKFLISKFKIAKNRLTAKGYGPSQPVADNSTAEGRLKNRRVVAHVTTETPATK